MSRRKAGSTTDARRAAAKRPAARPAALPLAAGPRAGEPAALSVVGPDGAPVDLVQRSDIEHAQEEQGSVQAVRHSPHEAGLGAFDDDPLAR